MRSAAAMDAIATGCSCVGPVAQPGDGATVVPAGMPKECVSIA